MRRGIILIPYLECRPLRPNWPQPPPLPQVSVSPPETKGGGGATHACTRVGDRESQIGRPERKPGTLSTLGMCVSSLQFFSLSKHLQGTATVTYPSPPSPANMPCALQPRGLGQAPRCLSLSYFSLDMGHEPHTRFLRSNP